MSSVNRVILIGRLGKDPEYGKTTKGIAVANFSLATSESYTEKATLEKKEITTWHQCVAFGNLADIVGKYLAKGSQIYVSGKLQTRSYEDKAGIKKFITEICCLEIIMLGKQENRNTQPVESSGHQEPVLSHSLGNSPVDDLPF